VILQITSTVHHVHRVWDERAFSILPRPPVRPYPSAGRPLFTVARGRSTYRRCRRNDDQRRRRLPQPCHRSGRRRLAELSQSPQDTTYRKFRVISILGAQLIRLSLSFWGTWVLCAMCISCMKVHGSNLLWCQRFVNKLFVKLCIYVFFVHQLNIALHRVARRLFSPPPD